jgi:predicted SAM-dependent methyltransferase
LTDYTKVQAVIGAIIRNRKFFINKIRISRKAPYLNVGCGPNITEHFINLDWSWRPGIDLCWDLKKGIPLPDKSVAGIYTEHCLEHLPLKLADLTIAELSRLLKSGGRVRIVVPDGEMYLNSYTDISRGLAKAKMPYAEHLSYHGIYTPIMSVNTVFSGHGHQFIYDFETLYALLERHGFVNIERTDYLVGSDRHLLVDSEFRAVESLYVEAVSP